jgi:hypothetical protein
MSKEWEIPQPNQKKIKVSKELFSQIVNYCYIPMLKE